ncbi:hypothetical protein Ahy_B05g076591 isoform A [Arachis hypogaea]|uniref:Uncharacterized protein n=1 Tax=Arachis hypogaea TaxID=3818 RepID=A0A444Z3J6_ARAHY|nr:hypothetical protein Ahy_B05g076591 isoform A [Arachis hypogaea]
MIICLLHQTSLSRCFFERREIIIQLTFKARGPSSSLLRERRIRSPSFLPLFFSSTTTVPHFHLRFHHAREKETLKENPSFSSSLLLFSHHRRCLAGSPSPRSNPFTEKQSCHRAAVKSPSKTPVAVAVQLERQAAVQSPSKTPVAVAVQLDRRAALLSPSHLLQKATPQCLLRSQQAMRCPVSGRLKLGVKLLSPRYVLQRTAACLPNPRPILDQRRGRFIQLMWVQLREQLQQIHLQKSHQLEKMRMSLTMADENDSKFINGDIEGIENIIYNDNAMPLYPNSE